ncbi:MAG: hypothetical protein KDD35_03530 [Bdellovibrionales bacterium]|nr:hypothetical protein [Bdellovibrionales bacterium]
MKGNFEGGEQHFSDEFESNSTERGAINSSTRTRVVLSGKADFDGGNDLVMSSFLALEEEICSTSGLVSGCVACFPPFDGPPDGMD